MGPPDDSLATPKGIEGSSGGASWLRTNLNRTSGWANLPSGKCLHDYGEMHHFSWEKHGNITISMVIFNGELFKLPERSTSK